MIERGALWRGATAGFVAAGAMSVLRMAAHRVGLIERMVPQELHTELVGVDPSSETPEHQFAAELLHHAVGMIGGAMLAAVAPRRPRLIHGLGLGLGLLAVDVFALIPALRVARVGGYAVDVVAHALYGVIVAFAIGELAKQRHTPSVRARLRRVG